MKFENALVCDDIRTEDTSKRILIGLYSENILVRDFPANLLLAFYVQFYADRNGNMTIELRILQNRKLLVGGASEIVIKDHTKIVTVSFVKIPVRVNGKGMLVFQMKEKDKRWKTVKKIPIEKLTPAE